MISKNTSVREIADNQGFENGGQSPLRQIKSEEFKNSQNSPRKIGRAVTLEHFLVHDIFMFAQEPYNLNVEYLVLRILF